MSESRLPMSVIGGYLGSGKTTLINQLLAEPHGKHLMVLVNDFGSINIDASLLLSADEDTLTLTNGCVCCSMGADLYMAIADVLDRSPRPDHLIIEASGIADPAKIANAAIAEPDLHYGGIVSMIDGGAFQRLVEDPHVGQQVTDQVACADILLVSKVDNIPATLVETIGAICAITPVLVQNSTLLMSQLLVNPDIGAPAKEATEPHPDYYHWVYSGDACFTESQIRTICQSRPAGLFRIKGFVKGGSACGWCIQGVGCDLDITRMDNPDKTELVAIGLLQQTNDDECHTWWLDACSLSGCAQANTMV